MNSAFKAGVIPTRKLVDFAKNDPTGAGTWGDRSREFSKIVRNLVPALSKKSGFYCWGCLSNKEVSWQTLYVGQSHDLERRLLEGLSKERIAFWKQAGTLNEDKFQKLGKERHGDKWDEYVRGWERCLEKARTTHIVWVATPNMAHIRLELIEEVLIHRLGAEKNRQNNGNKTTKLECLMGNVRDKIEGYAKDVEQAFNEQISRLKASN